MDQSALTQNTPQHILIARRPHQEVKRQAALFRGELLHTLLDAVTNSVVILNDCRQMVHANRVTLELLETDLMDDVLGMRPGELFDCAHAHETAGGCGTTESCRQCGAMRAIMKGLDGLESEDECRIIRHAGLTLEAFDLRVRATPFLVGDEQFVIIAFNDVSHEKRRRALERIFFHDILNTAGGLRSFMELLMDEVPERLREDTAMLHRFFSMLLDEIKAHKMLLAAESDELAAQSHYLQSRMVLQSVLSIFAGSDLVKGKNLRLAPDGPGMVDINFTSDATMVHRVLLNLVKNALEAGGRGESVTVGCSVPEDPAYALRFWVHNQAVIPREVQVQIFNRSFSTKGEGRGLGTYSVKLLTERFLKGRAEFVSNDAAGTTFSVLLPERV